MTQTLLKLSISLTLLASGCTGIHEKWQIETDFRKEYPNYKVISVGEPDGNDTTFVTFFIRYKKPDDEREFWVDWSYDTKDGKLKFASKGEENIYSEKAQP